MKTKIRCAICCTPLLIYHESRSLVRFVSFSERLTLENYDILHKISILRNIFIENVQSKL